VRYIIVGPGAIGGTIGGRLAQHGVPVVWVARGEHARVLAERGLTLRTPTGAVQVRAPVWTGPHDAGLSNDDVLVVATKTQHAAAALSAWSDAPVPGPAGPRRAGGLLPVVLATNGVHAEQIALRYFRRVWGMCVWAPAAHLVPGEVVSRFTPSSGVFHVGRYPAQLTDDTDRRLLAELRRDWQASLLTVPLPDDVMAWKYRKLISNIANIVEGLVGTQIDEELVSAAVDEARVVLAAAGVAVVDDETEASARRGGPQVAPVPGVQADLGGSTWQSLMRTADTVETDYLNGEIAALAAELGLDAPINTALAALAREAVEKHWKPGVFTSAELAQLLSRVG
jgi:2-dehydropantoate 2-reductase